MTPSGSGPAAQATGADRPAPAVGAPAFTAEGDHLDVAALHAQGIDHQIGDYRVQMDSFTPDATAEVMGANQFNREPEEGAYAIARWTVTYTGAAEGNPWMDIQTAVMGADGVQYASNQCAAVIEDGLMTEVRTLNPGGVYTFAVCYDAPAAALQSATAVRAGTLQRTDRVDWSMRPSA